METFFYLPDANFLIKSSALIWIFSFTESIVLTFRVSAFEKGATSVELNNKNDFRDIKNDLGLWRDFLGYWKSTKEQLWDLISYFESKMNMLLDQEKEVLNINESIYYLKVGIWERILQQSI